MSNEAEYYRAAYKALMLAVDEADRILCKAQITTLDNLLIQLGIKPVEDAPEDIEDIEESSSQT